MTKRKQQLRRIRKEMLALVPKHREVTYEVRDVLDDENKLNISNLIEKVSQQIFELGHVIKVFNISRDCTCLYKSTVNGIYNTFVSMYSDLNVNRFDKIREYRIRVSFDYFELLGEDYIDFCLKNSKDSDASKKIVS